MNGRARFQTATNYAVYYGPGQSNVLGGYDVAVVEPMEQNAADLGIMHASKTLVLAYASAMEIHPSHPMFRWVKDEDFVTVGGRPLMNQQFGTYIVDLTSKRWRGLFHHEIGRQLLHSGYDGIFIDTIGDVEMTEIPEPARTEQLHAAVDLIKSLRTLFPDAILIQNNGLEELCMHTGEYLDGICWENPPLAQGQSIEWSHRVIQRLEYLKKQFGLQSMWLVETAEGTADGTTMTAQTLAQQHDFLFYCAPKDYVHMWESD